MRKQLCHTYNIRPILLSLILSFAFLGSTIVQAETCTSANPNAKNYYPDQDGDAWGTAVGAKTLCAPQAGYVLQSGDCDDTNKDVKPGGIEICNGKDDDCDNKVDDGLTTRRYYQDTDGDGFGKDLSYQTGCNSPDPTWVVKNGDCDDANNKVHPDMVELCDGIDNNCTNSTDEGLKKYWYKDNDGDGYGYAASKKFVCLQPVGYVDNPNDCGDISKNTYPGAPETCDNRFMDNDCDGDSAEIDSGQTLYFDDQDRDAYGEGRGESLCVAPPRSVTTGGDCDGTNKNIHPAAEEICDGKDNDCNGLTDEIAACKKEEPAAQKVIETKPLIESIIDDKPVKIPDEPKVEEEKVTEPEAKIETPALKITPEIAVTPLEAEIKPVESETQPVIPEQKLAEPEIKTAEPETKPVEPALVVEEKVAEKPVEALPIKKNLETAPLPETDKKEEPVKITSQESAIEMVKPKVKRKKPEPVLEITSEIAVTPVEAEVKSIEPETQPIIPEEKLAEPETETVKPEVPIIEEKFVGEETTRCVADAEGLPTICADVADEDGNSHVRCARPDGEFKDIMKVDGLIKHLSRKLDQDTRLITSKGEWLRVNREGEKIEKFSDPQLIGADSFDDTDENGFVLSKDGKILKINAATQKKIILAEGFTKARSLNFSKSGDGFVIDKNGFLNSLPEKGEPYKIDLGQKISKKFGFTLGSKIKTYLHKNHLFILDTKNQFLVIYDLENQELVFAEEISGAKNFAADPKKQKLYVFANEDETPRLHSIEKLDDDSTEKFSVMGEEILSANIPLKARRVFLESACDDTDEEIIEETSPAPRINPPKQFLQNPAVLSVLPPSTKPLVKKPVVTPPSATTDVASISNTEPTAISTQTPNVTEPEVSSPESLTTSEQETSPTTAPSETESEDSLPIDEQPQYYAGSNDEPLPADPSTGSGSSGLNLGGSGCSLVENDNKSFSVVLLIFLTIPYLALRYRNEKKVNY